MLNKLIVLSLFLFSFISIAGAQEETIKTWYIADAKIGCQVGDAITSCYKLKDSLTGEWRNFPYEIEGFQHEKGFEYVIEVLQVKLKYPEDNGPAFKWSLIREVSKKSTVFTDKRLLTNNTFYLINIEQYGKQSFAARAKPFIKFGIDTNEISGFSGCNSFSGPATYATAFMEFGPMNNTLKTCPFQDIEDKMMQALKGRATFYVRNKMLYVVCENFMTLHLKPEKSLDSIFRIMEEEKKPLNDVNFAKSTDGSYMVNAPTSDNKAILFFKYRSAKLTLEEKKKIKMKFLPIGASAEFAEIHILNKPHEKPHMYYATVIYKNGKQKEIEIRDAD